MKKKVLILMTVIMVFVSSFITCYASDYVPPPPEYNGTGYDNYVMYKSYGGHMSDYAYGVIVYQGDDWDYTIVEEYGKDYIKWTKLRDEAYVRYAAMFWEKDGMTSTTNNGWGTLNQYNDMNSKAFGHVEIISSSENVYRDDGTLVFQVPPLLAEKVEEGLQNFQVKTSQMMKILVLCGVGCLALLTSLKLLPRVFSIFRV